MAWFQLLHFTKSNAHFVKVVYRDGEMKSLPDQIYTLQMPDSTQSFSKDVYYEFQTDQEEKQFELSLSGWRQVTAEEIIEADNERIAADLEKGRMPADLSEEQEAHNKRAIDALQNFMESRRKKPL